MKLTIFLLSFFLALQATFSLSAVPKADLAGISYHVWSDPEPASNAAGNRNLLVEVPHNSTFVQVMDEAAKRQPQSYSYDYIQYPFGKYIIAIGGVYEEPQDEIYWMIYKLNTTSPNPSQPPSEEYLTPVGVDGIIVQHGDTYLFWRTQYGHSR